MEINCKDDTCTWEIRIKITRKKHKTTNKTKREEKVTCDTRENAI
jgi:hypothetical protein